MIGAGRFSQDETVLFWHTGDESALHAYSNELGYNAPMIVAIAVSARRNLIIPTWGTCNTRDQPAARATDFKWTVIA